MALVVGSVVNENVYGAKGVDGLSNGGLKGGHVGQIAMEIERGPAALGGERGCEPMGGLVLNVDKGDARALAGEERDDGLADTGSAAGDDYGAVFEAGISGKGCTGILHS